MARAAATRAGRVAGFAQAGLQALPRQFHQTKARNFSGLHPGAIGLERIFKAIFHITLIARAFHVDEVDYHQAA